MNFVQEDQRLYCNNEEDQEDEEASRQTTILFPSSSSSPSSKDNNNSTVLPQHQNLCWLGKFESQEEYKRRETVTNFYKKIDLIDLSLGTNDQEASNSVADSTINIEKEQMFDKVVTPSDVGKLNRLVIPKQHAEKFFPLDSSSNEKGLLLNFEDRNGKPWRFRYSYWNSSQSYVMTKGWSRFVKEKKLDAGDIVSFQRGVGELGKDRLYIDWRRRPKVPDPASLAHIHLQNQLDFPQSSMSWARLYSLPQPVSMYDHYQRLNYSRLYPYHHHYQYHQQHHKLQQQQHHQQQVISYGNAAAPAKCYFRASRGIHIGTAQEGGRDVPMVIDSVPIVHGKSTGKRLRLFGVNMECATQNESSARRPHDTMGSRSHYLPSSSLSPLQSRLSSSGSMKSMQAEYSKKGKSSLSFDLDL
ncbi:B3 domain-containing protein [Cephalotus follicularis]|uniref:B3 domain-containing protein n=1 Tax=Cephalotus follicularis TaxID=3775 RepID=A0A1Q3BZI9_CEPFO|nr:B3 domain-containing protein [Cephalotus follicularis]